MALPMQTDFTNNSRYDLCLQTHPEPLRLKQLSFLKNIKKVRLPFTPLPLNILNF